MTQRRPRRRAYPRPRASRALVVVPLAALGAMVASLTVVALPSDNVSLTAGSTVTLTGHGHGHGRGLGQWGAYGYSKQGWSFSQILAHYYGGTSATQAGNKTITVQLTGHRSASVYSDVGIKVGPITTAPGQAVSISGSTATIRSSCGGGVLKTVDLGANPVVGPVNGNQNRPANELLTFCGSNDAYRGSVGLVNGVVSNVVGLDDYVKGVVPRESSAGWADNGGAEALKAQAVAARTYALACQDMGRTIDDTQRSQVYGGARDEDPRTNAAVDATSGVILTTGGKAAFTEFSASTGGYSAGVNFPAVKDAGDDIAPDHDWTASVSASKIGSAFGVGGLRAIEVVQANGLGPNYGRALKVRITGTGGTKEVTGDDVRTTLGLKSDFFSVNGQSSKPQIVAPPAGTGPDVPAGLGSPVPTIPGIDTLITLAKQMINSKFTDLGGPNGPLGALLGPLSQLPGGGFIQQFTGGSIVWSALTGAQGLNLVNTLTYILQSAAGLLGLPVSDAVTPNQLATFQYGTIAPDGTVHATPKPKPAPKKAKPRPSTSKSLP